MSEKQNIDFFKKEAALFCSKKENDSKFFSAFFSDEISVEKSLGKIVFENKHFAVQEMSLNNSLIIDKSKVKIVVLNEEINKFVEKRHPQKVLGKTCMISHFK